MSRAPGERGRITLVINPSSGKGRAQEWLPGVAGHLRDSGHELDIWLSRSFAEAEEMTRNAVTKGSEVLVVMGGDGMMHLGVNACAYSETVLGMIPAGTGNDLCRGVELDPKNPMAAAAAISAGRTRRIDLARVGDTYVGAIVATGFDALVNRRANGLTWPKGSMRYSLATMAELRGFAALPYRLTIDGQVRELDAMLVAVGNTRSYGGGMLMCPDADPSDGLLDVTIIHPVGRVKLLRLLPLVYSGRFVRDPCVERLRAREVHVEGGGLVGMGDGELLGSTPLTVRVEPSALDVVVPA